MHEFIEGQIEPADPGILVEIAQDIGELQCASEMMRQRSPVVFLHAEHAHGQAADRARHPVAVEIERPEARRADVAEGVHLHAVDQREEVLLGEPELAHRREPVPQCAGSRRLDKAP